MAGSFGRTCSHLWRFVRRKIIVNPSFAAKNNPALEVGLLPVLRVPTDSPFVAPLVRPSLPHWFALRCPTAPFVAPLGRPSLPHSFPLCGAKQKMGAKTSEIFTCFCAYSGAKTGKIGAKNWKNQCKNRENRCKNRRKVQKFLHRFAGTSAPLGLQA